MSNVICNALSSRSQMFLPEGVLKNYANFTGKQENVACNFFKKRLQHRCFPVKFAKFLRTPFFTEQLRWLLPMSESKYALNNNSFKKSLKQLVLNVYYLA